MAVTNQFTKNKDWQRLQTLDATISKLRRQVKELYLERIELVERVYNGCGESSENYARAGARARGNR